MRFKSKSNWLIVPIETKAREFCAKLLLSCVAAEKGFSVVLGGQQAIHDNLAKLPKGTLFDKSIVPLRATLFEQYRSIGLRVVAWCEEGLTINDPDEYMRRRVNAMALKQVKMFYAWGNFQAQLIESKFPEHTDKILPYGNSRIDLLRPELRAIFKADADALRSRHGRFVLVNTNFSLCNHKMGKDAFLADMKLAGKITNQQEEDFIVDWINHKKGIFEAFKVMMPVVEEHFPQHKVIIRPHPSENHDAWRSVAGSHDRIEVAYEGAVAPWIMAADAVVHNGCTTGIEAFVLGRTAVAYQPVTSKIHDAHLPNDLSLKAYNIYELFARLEMKLGVEPADVNDDDKRWAVARNYMSNLDGRLATDVIVDSLKSLLILSGRQHGEPSSLRVHLLRTYLKARTCYRNATGHRPQLSEHSLQKFPGLELEEVVTWMDRMRKATGRFYDVSVRKLGDDMFVIESARERGKLRINDSEGSS